MAIAIDASSQFSSDPTNAQPVTYTGPTVNAPAGADIIVFACCDAPPGNPTSTIVITGLTGGNTVFEVLTINQGGFGAGPAAITVWAGTANGTPFEVTQQGQNGAQNSHAQGVYILTGATGIVATGNFRGTGTPTISDTAPGPGHLALCGFIDSPNTLDTMSGAAGDPGASLTVTDQAVVPDADTVPSFFGHKFIAGAVAFQVGVNALPNQGETNGIMVLVEPEADPTVTGTLAITLPMPQVALDGELTAAGSLDVVLPIPAVDLAGELTAAGVLDVVLPVPSVNLDGNVPVSGVLNIVLPVPDVQLTGNSAAGGTIMGPCGWTIPDPLCCDTWAATPVAVQAAARDYAALILWAATGQQFGLCEITVRPCGMKPCGADAFTFWGTTWNAGTWTPYLFNGSWFNCRCPNVCCCEPRCQIRLMGDVAAIVEVTIGGVALDPSAYRVDDLHWLVRIDGECWPECGDLDSDDGPNVLEVTYLRGNPVPPALLNAAATLACEWAKACTGGDCRLSNRVTSISRSGIDISMVDPNDLLDNGLTGLWEVDSVIRALNPYMRKQRGRIYAPELNVPRMPNP